MTAEPALITLVRHGETDWNRAGRIQGSSDIPLNDTGRGQAAEAVSGLAGTTFDAVYASPLSRASETARIIADGLRMPQPEPLVVPALAERNYGEIEGCTAAELRELFPDDVVPARESVESVLERAGGALRELATRHPGGRLLVVSHGAVIGALLRDASAGSIPPAGSGVRNASAHDVEVGAGGIRVVRFDRAVGPDDEPEAVREVRRNPVADAHR